MDNNYVKLELEFPSSVLVDAQKIYRASNARKIAAGFKPEKMPTYFLVELIQKTVAQNLNAQKKQFAAERAVALAELQAKGIAYKDACKLLGITMTESAQENAPAAIATK